MSLSCVWWRLGERRFDSRLMFKNSIKFRGGLKRSVKLKVRCGNTVKACEGPSQRWLGESAESSGFFCGSPSRTYWADRPGCWEGHRWHFKWFQVTYTQTSWSEVDFFSYACTDILQKRVLLWLLLFSSTSLCYDTRHWRFMSIQESDPPWWSQINLNLQGSDWIRSPETVLKQAFSPTEMNSNK